MIVKEINVCHERFLDDSLSESYSYRNPRHSLETGCIFTEFFCGDKCSYIDFRYITDFEFTCYFWLLGSSKTRRL